MSAKQRNSLPKNESKNPASSPETEENVLVTGHASKSGTARRSAEDITADGTGSDAPADDDNRFDAG
jgi:hypothetical protein